MQNSCFKRLKVFINIEIFIIFLIKFFFKYTAFIHVVSEKAYYNTSNHTKPKLWLNLPKVYKGSWRKGIFELKLSIQVLNAKFKIFFGNNNFYIIPYLLY